MRKIAVAGIAIVALAVASEIGARYAGVIDFPLYEANNRVGYLPLPNQSGSFMGKIDFYTNDLSMGVARVFENTETDILLIGDNLVRGGNAYKQADKLGPQLQFALDAYGAGTKVWPNSAGSWTIVNEANWLEDHPAVVSAAETMIFVLNSEDFGQPASWRNPFTHPRERPISALAYFAKKYILPPQAPPIEADLTAPSKPAGEALAAALAACSCRAEIWLHPMKSEMRIHPDQTALEINFAKIEDLLPEGADVHRIREIPGWKQNLYRDQIHPNSEGMKIFGSEIAKRLALRTR
ncbi:hypothetical protein M3484_02035 [Pseudomonas sp. GX19020]|uniref:hypothetical protein n=1 Tax=Pseudomonas sp. GX19020 TaxID=2942277 RepID=UPI0020189BED|nr:hypothetical protein [Pseudomonas sp. GX19020]MCL4065356.1 hypothetical protein [Pseudomonas sp. GX19020]